MKQLLLTAILAITSTTFAQIEFQHDKSWAEIVQLAQKENKMIFVDAYTTWCGPCKWMAANTFTDKGVGKVYNEAFISVKIDMEKGEGIDFAKKHNVQAYPTILYFDKNGELVHRTVGAVGPKDFEKTGVSVQNPENQLVSLEKKYETGDRSPEFLKNLANAAMNSMHANSKTYAKAYLAAIPKDKWKHSDNHSFVYEAADSFEGEHYVYIQEHAKDFDQAQLAYCNQNIYQVLLGELVAAKNQAGLNALFATVKKYDAENAIPICNNLELTYFRSIGDKESYTKAKERMLSEGTDADLLNSTAWNYFETKTDAADLNKALGWAKRSVEISPSYANTDTYANLLLKTGDKENARIWAEKSIALGKKEGADVSATEELLKLLK